MNSDSPLALPDQSIAIIRMAGIFAQSRVLAMGQRS